MMGENPNYWWSLNGKMSPPSDDHIQQPSPTFMSPPAVGGAAAAPPPTSLFHPHQYLFGSSLLIPPTTNSDLDDDNHHDDVINQQDFPLSWSQLLMGEIGGDEGQMMMNPWLRTTWSRSINGVGEAIKQELQVDQTRHDQSSIYRDDHHHHHNNFNNININDQDEDDDDENGSQVCSSSWSSHQIPSASSCVTSLTSTNSILDFSTKRKQTNSDLRQCEDISSGGASKRARFQASTTRNPLSTCKTTASKKTRVQHSSSQPPLKIRKEKLGDRITALHQLVSPFGKTDTASVLFEATAHIRFLEGQIEALTSPYLKLRTTTVSASMRHQLSAERIIALNPGLKPSAITPFCVNPWDGEVAEKDLRSRGLCLVPITCIDHIANDSINGSDYWTPALGGSF